MGAMGDFIIGLAHFCEDHGPTSILCTQVVPPTCAMCYPQASNAIARTPSNGSTAPTPPRSSHGLSAYKPDAILRSSLETTPAPSSRGASPSDTPPSSPRNPFASSTALQTAASGYPTADACKNCSISFPKAVNDSLSGVGSGAAGDARGNKPRLRSTETVVVGATSGLSSSAGSGAGSPHLSSSPRSNSYLDTGALGDRIASGSFGTYTESGPHTHAITYISCRAPALPSRYATVRQACVRTLNCENVPSQTGSIMFGDPLAGYTIANVFKISDGKARGGRRTYALLCMSPNQKALITSWRTITGLFESIVMDIQRAVAEKAAQELRGSPPSLGNSMSSISSRGPEGFLRRRAPGDGGSQQSLSELVGKDDFFVDMHAKFTRLLSSLIRIYGFAQTPPTMLEAPSPSARSRAPSISSSTPGGAQDPSPPSRSNAATSATPDIVRTSPAAAPVAGPPLRTHTLSVSETSSSSSSGSKTPTATPTPPILDEPRRQVAVGY